MQSAKQQVINLINDYQTAIYRAVELLNARSEQQRGFQQQQERPGVWAGYLDDLQQVRYEFHGIGCLVSIPTLTVDFDFAHAGGCAGIDAWFMADFLERNPAVRAKYPLLTSAEQLARLLRELASEHVLTQYNYSPDDWRYYLAAASQSAPPPSVTLHLPDEDAAP